MCSPHRPAGTPPAASQMRAAPDPRILTGWSGASPHVLRFPPRAFLRFPVCPPGSPPSPAFLRFPVVRRSPVRPLRPLPGFRFPLSVSLRVPFPMAIFTIALPPGGSAGVGPGRQGPRSPALPPPPVPGSRRHPPSTTGGQRPGTMDAATESPVTSGRERRTPPRPNRPDRRDCVRSPGMSHYSTFIVGRHGPREASLRTLRRLDPAPG